MTTLTPEQIAALNAKIAKKYTVLFSGDDNYDFWGVANAESHIFLNDNDHEDHLDAEAEMDAIIQDEVKAAMEEVE